MEDHEIEHLKNKMSTPQFKDEKKSSEDELEMEFQDAQEGHCDQMLAKLMDCTNVKRSFEKVINDDDDEIYIVHEEEDLDEAQN
jgi:hypothetical protein